VSDIKVKEKRSSGVKIKSGPLGEVNAVVATLDVIDHDGDVATASTFTDGDELVISAYNHSSMHGYSLPVGKGVLRVGQSQVTVDAEFFMMNATARESFEVIRGMGAACEWSYGYKILDAEPTMWGNRRVNMLKKVEVFEASPVIRGAGIGTRTLTAKEELEELRRQWLRSIRDRWVPKEAAALSQQRELEARAQAMQLRLLHIRDQYLASRAS
jgi:hypothetical protein